MPLPCRLLSMPPVTAMSVRAKSVAASLRVKLMVSPALPTVPLLVRAMAMVGGVTSVLKAKLTWLLTSCTAPEMPDR